jgi:hypothetical protein
VTNLKPASRLAAQHKPTSLVESDDSTPCVRDIEAGGPNPHIRFIFSPTCFMEAYDIIKIYVGVLISFSLFLFPIRIFLFAAQPKEFFLDVLKKLEQRSHKCVELKGNM